MTKILLVEDNEMNQDMLTRRLLRRGYEVVCAMDGQAGVEMAHSEMPDLILMDMSLPIMDGWETTRRLKADDKTRSIPIIALTAHAMVGDRQKSIDAGCDDYDTKPVELSRLLSKIETLLASSQLKAMSDNSPLEQPEIAAIPEQIGSPPPARSVDPTAATILIVDDIETNRDMLGRRLERAGYTIVLAEGGRQGLEIIDRQQIDLVLLDIMMPDFNGIETLQAIRAKYSMAQLPVIMATAKDRSEDMLQAFELGANDYVTKPIDLPVVLARIQSHLRLMQLAHQQQPNQPIQSHPPAEIEQTAKSPEQIFDPTTLEPANQLLLGRYKISQQLVRDNFQNIYLAQDTKQHQQAICIVRRIELNKDNPRRSVTEIDLFKREIEVFGQLSQHHNIAGILDVFQQEQQLYLIQEYIGENLLANKLKLGQSVGIADALILILEILKIIQQLHQHQIVHQHLDANCFAYRQDGKLVLVELGIVARLSATLPQNVVAAAGNDNRHSAKIYQMPAQWNERFTASSDIYTIGTIVLHALTGTPPDRMPIDRVTGAIDWRNLCVVSERFARILNKMICKDSVDRYNSIEAVLEDLYHLPMVSILLKYSRTLV